jgi:hypothetical protein
MHNKPFEPGENGAEGLNFNPSAPLFTPDQNFTVTPA